MYDYLFKCVIVGDTNVGKSCLLLQFINKKYREIHETTIGVEFGHNIITIDDNSFNKVSIKLHVWDTAGQEYFQSITRAYYRGAAGVLLVYDISERNTFTNIILWLDEVKNNNTNLPSIILVGNKKDLTNREVTTEEGLFFAKKHNLLFYETSAKLSENNKLIFIELAKHIYNNLNNNNNNKNYYYTIEKNGIKLGPNNIRLQQNTIENTKKCCIK